MLQFPKLLNSRRQEGKVPSPQLLSILLRAVMSARRERPGAGKEVRSYLPGTDYNPGMFGVVVEGAVRVVGDDVGSA